jgi:Rod binding domain-containing protein
MNALPGITDTVTPRSVMMAAPPAAERSLSFFDRLEHAGKLQNVEAIEEQVTEAAEKLIADLFIQPMLAQARSGPFKSELFSGGMAEEMFAPHLDAELAGRMSRSADWPLTRSLVDQLMAAYRRPEAATAAKGVDLHG